MEFTEVREDYPNGTMPGEPDPDWDDIFSAPDYSALVRPAASVKAKHYQKRVNSLLKAGVIGCINAGDFPDAAAILFHGPQFAAASGQFAASNKRAEQAIDLLTSPASPLAMFALTIIPLMSQLVRNHEDEVLSAPQSIRQRRMRARAEKQSDETKPPRFTIRLGKLRVPIRIRMRFKIASLFSGFKSQTRDPIGLTEHVFSDPDLIAALEKQGIRPRNAGNAPS